LYENIERKAPENEQMLLNDGGVETNPLMRGKATPQI
jgi:hypothetical protein